MCEKQRRNESTFTINILYHLRMMWNEQPMRAMDEGLYLQQHSKLWLLINHYLLCKNNIEHNLVM